MSLIITPECTGAQVSWFKGDSRVKASRYFIIGSDKDVQTLTITEAFPEDEGVYKIVVTSPTGSAQSEGRLRLVRE